MKVNYIDEFFVLRNLSTVLFFFLNRHIASLHISILNLCGRPFSKCTPSSSCVKPVVAFHGRLCPSLSFLSAEPWIPGSPFAPFFPSTPRGHWVPVFPGLPRSPLAPSRPGAPGAPGTHVMYVHIPVCPPLQVGQDETGCQKEKCQWQNAFSSWQFYLSFSVSIKMRK